MIFSCLRCGKKEDDDRDRLKKKLKEKKTEVGEQYSIDVQMRSGLVFLLWKFIHGSAPLGSTLGCVGPQRRSGKRLP